MSDQAFCTNCGAPIQSTAEFCTGCGKSLKPKPKPKPFYKLWWFWTIVAAIIGFGVIGAHDGGSNQSATSNDNSSSKVSSATAPAADSKKTASAPAAPAKPEPAPKPSPAPASTPPVQKPKVEIHYIGDKVQVGNFEVRVDGVQKASFVGDNYLNKQANGVFWAVKVDVLNNDTKARVVDESMFHLFDLNGAKYEADPEADMYANTSNNFFLNQVNPHLTTSGYVVFDMPADAKNITMKIDSGVLLAGGKSAYIYLGPN